MADTAITKNFRTKSKNFKFHPSIFFAVSTLLTKIIINSSLSFLIKRSSNSNNAKKQYLTSGI